MKFDYYIANIQQQVQIVKSACLEVLTSKKFKQILEIILAVGNYLNSGTNRGGAFGISRYLHFFIQTNFLNNYLKIAFKLDTLPKVMIFIIYFFLFMNNSSIFSHK